jgi:hypothetical protein
VIHADRGAMGACFAWRRKRAPTEDLTRPMLSLAGASSIVARPTGRLTSDWVEARSREWMEPDARADGHLRRLNVCLAYV